HPADDAEAGDQPGDRGNGAEADADVRDTLRRHHPALAGGAELQAARRGSRLETGGARARPRHVRLDGEPADQFDEGRTMNKAVPTPVLDAAQVNALIQSVYPQLNAEMVAYEAVEVFPGGCVVRLNATEKHLRPGNT